MNHHRRLPAALALFFICASASAQSQSQTQPAPSSYKFSFASNSLPDFTPVDVSARYTDAAGFGFDNGGGAYPTVSGDHITASAPFYFSVMVPEGSYQVTVHLGGATEATTTVKAELRRLMLEKIHTAPGEQVTKTFAVSVRRPPILDAAGKQIALTKVKAREVGRGGALNRTPGGEGWSWDNSLTLEFSGTPALQAVEIFRDDSVHTVFVAGDSTVCDQPVETYTSWGQVITRWLKPDMVVSNLAISGETMPAFLGENRLKKITSQMKPGDYCLVQFGHNDMKSTSPTALDTYKKNLVRFITETKAAGGIPVLFTPVSRETFDATGKITNSFITAKGDNYVQAVHDVAREQYVTLIDLNAMSLTLYETIGQPNSQALFATAAEKTHHSDYGSYEIAKCVLQGIADAKLPLADHYTSDWKPFDPAYPDTQANVNLPPDPMPNRAATPAGN